MTLLGVKRVAIYGGSFNPIHRGHLAVAQCAVEQGAADEVWLMVSPQNPLKAADGLMDEQVRLLLAQRATRNLPAVRVSDFEFHLPRPSYTWRTLSALQQHYPDCRFTLLVGSDNWALFPRWPPRLPPSGLSYQRRHVAVGGDVVGRPAVSPQLYGNP
jgi:nicotinate-nucleotide adenylyltransferase